MRHEAVSWLYIMNFGYKVFNGFRLFFDEARRFANDALLGSGSGKTYLNMSVDSLQILLEDTAPPIRACILTVLMSYMLHSN